MTAPLDGYTSKMYNRILITGSRNFYDWELMHKILTHAKSRSAPDALLIHGNARGADTLARVTWHELKMPHKAFHADWNKYGIPAGHIRNQQMVDFGADICLAFPLGKSPGTRNCMKLAEQAGIRVVNITGE